MLRPSRHFPRRRVTSDQSRDTPAPGKSSPSARRPGSMNRCLCCMEFPKKGNMSNLRHPRKRGSATRRTAALRRWRKPNPGTMIGNHAEAHPGCISWGPSTSAIRPFPAPHDAPDTRAMSDSGSPFPLETVAMLLHALSATAGPVSGTWWSRYAVACRDGHPEPCRELVAVLPENKILVDGLGHGFPDGRIRHLRAAFGKLVEGLRVASGLTSRSTCRFFANARCPVSKSETAILFPIARLSGYPVNAPAPRHHPTCRLLYNAQIGYGGARTVCGSCRRRPANNSCFPGGGF
jgi:hypothetical protein